MVARVDGARHQLTRRLGCLALLAAVAAGSACTPSDPRARTATPADTLHSPAEDLRRFRAPLVRVDELAPRFASKEDVARAFVAAVAANDVTLLAQTLMTRAEFAWLYYPESPVSQPPYGLPAGLAWFELEGNSLAGVRRALSTYAGSVAFRELTCDRPPVMQGANRLWNGCTVLLTLEDGSRTSSRMFATIVERDGHFKIASAANDL